MLYGLEKILSKLPGNGQKSIWGFVAILLSQFAPDFPQKDLDQIIDIVLVSGGSLWASLGVLHKYIKAKLGYKLF